MESYTIRSIIICNHHIMMISFVGYVECMRSNKFLRNVYIKMEAGIAQWV
jgi:hypothetical protein